MQLLLSCVRRNIKLFFKDKGLFFTSLITPLILLVLYSTFLSGVYKSSFEQVFAIANVTVSDKALSGLVSGQLMSSLLAVSCVTVSFSSNMLMVQDKVSGAYKDLMITPTKRSTLAISYYLATTISSLIVCYIALVACLIYVAFTGWFLSFADVILLILNVFLMVTFGTALSSVINFFLSSQGQISAIGSIVSSCYGFICGAYMPLASFSKGIRDVIMFLPGTYGTALFRNHSIRGALEEISKTSPEAVKGIKDSIDCNLYFFETQVQMSTMYIVVIASIALFITAYILINKYCKKIKK